MNHVPVGQVVRATVKLGKVKRSLVICAGPIPQVGDLCTVAGQDWTVVKVASEKVVAMFTRQGKKLKQAKLKQVFP